MTELRLALGAYGEEIAAAYLREQGYTLLERHFRCPVREIDIIAKKFQNLIFVEVKTRRSTLFGLPQDAVGAHKQRQLIRSAQWYLNQRGASPHHPRFDVIAILICPGQRPAINHIQNAFTLAA